MNEEWIRNWTSNIRNHCDLIDNRIDQMAKPSEADRQLEYVLLRIKQIEDEIQSLLIRPGKGKSYLTQTQTTRDKLNRLRVEVKYWQTDGLLPEHLEHIESKFRG